MSAINPLRDLKSSLERTQKNTATMLSKIRRFDECLSNIDQEMQPIQVTTATYTKAKENIALTLAEVEKTYEYFRIAQSVGGSISAGLSLNNPAKHKEFVDAFGRLSEAKRFFELNRRDIKSSSSALDQIEALIKIATNICVEELHRLLMTCGKSVAVDGDSFMAINPLPPAVAKDVKIICDILESNKITNHYALYEKVRVDLINEDLTSHRNKYASAWAALSSDVPYQPGFHPFLSLYSLALETIRGELQLWGSSFPSSVESLNVLANIAFAVVTQLDVAIQPLLDTQSSDIVMQGNALLIRLETFYIFLSKFEDFRDVCKPDLRHENDASLRLISLRDSIVQSIVRSIDWLLQNSLGANSATTIQKRRSVGVVLGASSQGSSAQRGDNSCDVHPATSLVLNCCKGLSSLQSAYRQFHSMAISLKLPVPPSANSLAQLAFTLLQNLLQNLKKKADQLEPPPKYKSSRVLNVNVSSLFSTGEREAEESLAWARKHLFMANNLFAIYEFLKDRQSLYSESDGRFRSVSRDGDSDTARALNDIFATISARLQEERLEFCEAVATSLAVSPSDTAEFKALIHRGDKSGKNRVLKSKFSLFNSGLEALEGMRGEWRISAPVLRDELVAQLVSMILPIYSELFKTYAANPFSKKHSSQYLKFPPPTAERILKSFAG